MDNILRYNYWKITKYQKNPENYIYNVYRSSSKVKLPEEGKIDCPSHHHNKIKAIICRYIQRKVSIKLCLLLLVKFLIKRYELDICSESRDRAIDVNACLVSLNMDILYEHTQLFTE
jgi:hypothetical protein